MNIFESTSKRALKAISRLSDGQGLYNDGVNTAQLIDVVLNRDTEIIDEEGAVTFENTMDIESIPVVVGATITLSTRDWVVGRTLSDDGFIKTVIVQ